MSNNPSKEEIINQAFQFHSQGNIQEATKYYQSFINQGFEDYRVFSNYGAILKDLGKLKEAEVSTRKAIQLDPDLAIAFYSLSTFKLSNKNKIWRDKLFSKNLLNNKSKKIKLIFTSPEQIFFIKNQILKKVLDTFNLQIILRKI